MAQIFLNWLKNWVGKAVPRPDESLTLRLTRLLVRCPQCGFDNWPGMAYCGRCGARLGIECANCGFANPPDYRFCGRCGQPLIVERMAERAHALPPSEPLLEPRPTGEPRPAGEPRLAGERRSVTVLIADVKGSTQILEQIGTEAWVEVMNRVLHLLEAEVYRYGGQVDQFRGDGLVAFWGVSSAHEDDPERAVLAALSMQESIRALAQELAEQRNIDLRVRIGLNTGQVIVTSVGDSDQHAEDTAMGEAIALAARMEAAAEPGTVLVSENTYHIVAAHFRWQPLGEMAVKGLSKPVAVYRPLAPIFDLEPGLRSNVYGLQSALVGRDREVETFRQLVMGLAEQRGGILTITGEKGMGKSFLVAQVRQQFIGQDALMARAPWPAAEGNASAEILLTWIQVRCRSYEQSRPYSMWINLLRRWLEMAEDEPLSEARERLRERCMTLWPQNWDEYYPYLAALLSMPLEDEFLSLLTRHAEGLGQQLFFVLRSWVQELARRGPLVLALSDMHWIDATSLDVLRYCLPLCEQEALLWVLVFRPERTSIIWPFRYHLETEYPHRLTTIHLAALDEQGSRELIEQLIGPDVLPAETRDLIVRTAEGNPYYIREFVYSLIRQGVLVQDTISGHWYATRAVNSLKLPDTLQSLLLARIDALSAEERRVLQVAAVIGSVFWENVLAELLENITRADLRAYLTALERAQLIYEGSLVPVMGKEYIFKSTLICDAAYEGLLQSERVVYHRRIADYLAQLLDGHRAAPVARTAEGSSYDNLISFSLVAYHYHLAQVFDRELWYARAAAAQAQRVYANVEAVDLNRRVLELLDQMEATQAVFESLYPTEQGSWIEWRLDALVRLGQVCFGMGQLDEAEKAFRQAIELGETCALPTNRLVRLYYWLAESLYWQDRYDEQIAVSECGLALVGEESTFELALMNLELAGAYNMKGDVERFCTFTSRTAELVRRLPYAEELRPAYCHIAIMYAYRHKQVAEAMNWLELLEHEATQHHDLRALGEAYLVRGEILARQGNLMPAIQMGQQALELFERIQDVKHQSWCLSTLSRTCLVAGDLDKAQAYALRSLESAQQTGSRRFIKSAYWSLSSIYICRNDEAQAFDALHQVIAFSRETGDAQGVWWAQRALGRLYLERGETQQAAQCMQDALAALGRDLPAWTDLATLSRELEGIYDHQDVLQLFYRFVWQSDLAEALGTYHPFEPVHLLTVVEPARVLVRSPLDPKGGGWTWVDPLGDCVLSITEEVEIRAANGRDLWHINLSAPRLLYPLSGNWGMQCRCVPVAEDMPAIGGLLLWRDERNFVRLDWGVRGAGYVLLLGCLDGQDVILGHTQLPVLTAGLWLRMESVSQQVDLYCSTDGIKWSRVGTIKFLGGRSVQAGLYVVGQIDRSVYRGAYGQGAAMRFESFVLWRS